VPPMLGHVDLRAAAEELYALRPGEFVARRNALAQGAKEAGDKQVSADVKRLTKPSAAAWVVNMLVRQQPERLEHVLALGAALREAQAAMAGDELRRLGRQRRELIAAVTREARALAADQAEQVGDAVARQVEETLHAAMTDEDAAAAVRTGLLVRPLAVAGTETAGVVESVAVPDALGDAVVRRTRAPRPSRRRPELTVVEDDSRAVDEAEAQLARAETELAAAERKHAKATGKVEKREAKALQLQAEVEELRRTVAEAEQRLETNEEELAGAEEARDRRAESVHEAQREVDRAREALRSVQRRGNR
jgi:hypothetical protein